MVAATWLVLGSLFCSLQISAGSFPKPLTQEEERHYLELSAAGDLNARNVLIEHNLRLVSHIMKKYYTNESDQEDLISIGTIGLIKGITTFDSTILRPKISGRERVYAALHTIEQFCQILRNSLHQACNAKVFSAQNP